MQVTDYWPRCMRIVEIGAKDGSIGRSLIHAGFDRYLAVARNSRQLSSMLQRHASLTDHTVLDNSLKVVSQNNADVLILNGPFLIQLARFRAVCHAQFVAWRLRPTFSCVLASVIVVLQTLMGRFNWPRVVWCDAPALSRQRWAHRRLPLVVCRVRRPRPYSGVRRFIPHRLGVEGFFRRLQQHNVQYAILRWFESLPHVAPGEDIDLLVADGDLELLRALIDEGPGIQPVDVYSVTGLPGADFQSMPYYPPHLAEEMLARSALHRKQYRVLAPREHFLGLAYHALYHKGTASRLPRDANETRSSSGTQRGDHDYSATLRQLAQQAGFDTPITLKDLDAMLDSTGWRPPHDMLVRLARRNHWVRSVLNSSTSSLSADDRLAVFLVREEALRRGGVERAVRLLAQRGFQIVTTEVFDSSQIARISRSIRGGNWGRGPWPMSGGPPVAAIAVYDSDPILPSRRQRQRFTFLANARLLCKQELRDNFNDGIADELRCNVIHSSDNGREALDYLRITMPHRVEEILARAKLLRKRRAAA